MAVTAKITAIAKIMEATKMRDLSDHPFSPENIAYESGAYVAPDEREWLAFAAEVEHLLGHDLDGNDPVAFDASLTGGDGYSIDEAYEVWRDGKSASEYAAIVRARPRYQGRSRDAGDL